MKNKIIIERKDETNKGYKCDMSKQYSFAEDQVAGVIFGLVFMSILVIGIIFLLSFTPPSVSEDSTKLWPIIIFSIIGLLMIPILTYYCVKAVREKKCLIKMTQSAIVLVGKITFIQRLKMGTCQITVKFDNSNETIRIISKSRSIRVNQEVAVARHGDKQFVLTKCTLITNN